MRNSPYFDPPSAKRLKNDHGELPPLVDRTGDDLLARAGLAEEQHRRRATRDHVRARHHRRQPGVAADQPFIAARPVAGDQMLGQGPTRGLRAAHFLCHMLDIQSQFYSDGSQFGTLNDSPIASGT